MGAGLQGKEPACSSAPAGDRSQTRHAPRSTAATSRTGDLEPALVSGSINYRVSFPTPTANGVARWT